MLIDWFTVGAQVVNFLVLVWLLKRFLYKPILDAIDSREKRIAGAIADAESKKAEAKKEQDDFSNKNKAFDEERSALFSKVEGEAKMERDGLLTSARKDAENLRATQATELRDDQTRLSVEITRLATVEVMGIARKALADLATTSLEAQVEGVFVRHLRDMQRDSKQLMGDALKSAGGSGIIRSAFDLSDEQKTSIQKALNESFSADIHLGFEVDTKLVCGIELTGNGQKLDWNISAYLVALDRSLSTLVDSQAKAGVPSVPATEAIPKSGQDATAAHAGAN